MSLKIDHCSFLQPCLYLVLVVTNRSDSSKNAFYLKVSRR